MRLSLCTLLVVSVAITCLALLGSSSFRQPGVTSSSSEISKNDITRAGDVVDVSLVHGNVERVLTDGLLSLDPRDKASWSLWRGDPSGSPCSEYKTRFGMHMPRVWLASFPCSGNTWTRYLLEAASGIFTGSVYTDKKLIGKGFLGEQDSVTSMRTLVQKVHWTPSCMSKARGDHLLECPQDNGTVPTILLLRNPAKAIISFYKLRKTQNHTGQLPVSYFQTKDFRSFVSEGMKWWTELALDRLLWTKAPLHVMHYERLVQDPVKELTALLAFLGVPLDEGRMTCIASHLDGAFKREGSLVLDPYTAVQKAVMAAEAGAVNRTLQLLGYSPLPTYH